MKTLNLTRFGGPDGRPPSPEMKVARYLQVENKIRSIIQYELAAEIPLVE